MSQREKPADGIIYHVYNRGVEKREIFKSDSDRSRFVHALQIFNKTEKIFNAGRAFDEFKLIEVGLQSEQKLVKILAFALMPNHYHLMLEQIGESGITDFMRKIGTGYTNYFNQKYQRVGPLFQGKYKLAGVFEHRHLLYLPHYIHLNPLDMYEPEWRSGRVADVEKAMRFLKSYRWSSLHEYISNAAFAPLVDRGRVQELFENQSDYEKNLIEWLIQGDRSDLPTITFEPPDAD